MTVSPHSRWASWTRASRSRGRNLSKKGSRSTTCSPPPGIRGRLAATLAFVPVLIQLDVRRDGSYGLTATIEDLSTFIPLQAVSLTLWGVPADPSHDAQRVGPSPEYAKPTPAGVAPAPFMFASATARTVRSKLPVGRILAGRPGGDLGTHVRAHRLQPARRVLGRRQGHPGNDAGREPVGLSIDLSTPQDLEPYALATPDLRDVVVTLPAATVINPSAANGLTACPPAAFSLGSGAAVSCPPSSTVGSVQIDTPLLAAPLTGSLYLAEQTDNPFGSLIALYLLAEDGGCGSSSRAVSN